MVDVAKMNKLENEAVEIIQNETRQKKKKTLNKRISQLWKNFKQPDIQGGKKQKIYLKKVNG